MSEWRTAPGSPWKELRLCAIKGIMCEFADVSGCMSTACNKLFNKEANKMEDYKELQKIIITANFDKEGFQKEQDLIVDLVKAGLITDKDGAVNFMNDNAKKFLKLTQENKWGGNRRPEPIKIDGVLSDEDTSKIANIIVSGLKNTGIQSNPKKKNLSINVEVMEGMSKRDLHDICHKIAKRIQWGDTFSAGVFKDAANALWGRWVEEENDAKVRERRRQEKQEV